MRTSVPAAAARRADLLRRQFSPAVPDRLWVADFTLGLYLDRDGLRGIRDRRVLAADPGLAGRPVDEDRPALGRAGASTLDAAAGLCPRPGRAGPSHRRGIAQYTSIAFTERPAAAISGSVGTVEDAYDNALAESMIGLFKTEVIKPRGPWRTAEQVEVATLEYVDWFNHRRSTRPAATFCPQNSRPPTIVTPLASPRPARQQPEAHYVICLEVDLRYGVLQAVLQGDPVHLDDTPVIKQ